MMISVFAIASPGYGGGSAADLIWRTDLQIGNLLTCPQQERNLCQAAPKPAGATAHDSAGKPDDVNDGLSDVSGLRGKEIWAVCLTPLTGAFG
jgi:hypothetical protein